MKTKELAGFQYVCVPGSSDRTLLLLHGTGGDEESLIELGKAIDPKATLLSPRGKVLEDGQPRFFRRHSPGVLDQEDLQVRTHELADFIRKAGQELELSSTRLVAVGYSNGANIAASLLLLRPDVLSCAILVRPMVPLIPEELPDLSEAGALITSGVLDHMVPRQQVNELEDLLERSGAEVTVRWISAGHEVTDEDVQAAQEWLEVT